jgi:D-arabinose 1-dehydrogenase-like Zn-dependent alcohol dehydrogenase
VTDAKSMSDAVGGLGVDGRLVIVGASMEPVQVPSLALIPGRRSISGWPSGTASDSEDTMDFSVLSAIRPMIETYPLARAADAYERMMSGKARFRVVITP